VRVGLSFWGFQGDVKIGPGGEELSTPDGNATYTWSLIWEMQKRGHTVYAMQEDRDWHGFRRWGSGLFGSFSQEKRTSAYTNIKNTFGSSEILPNLDVLLIEWRFPIPGRNCEINKETGEILFPEHESQRGLLDEKYQRDLFRQTQILHHYKQSHTRIIFWDLDHKLTKADEIRWMPDAIFETSTSPLELSKKRVSVEPPFNIPDLLQHPTIPQDPNRKLVYIGSRYERDDIIDEWIKPVSEEYQNQVEFHGKWDDEAKVRWPNIKMGQRCTVRDFQGLYASACAVPLLAKKSYLETGFITPRVWEALLFGTLPVGLGTAKGIEKYTTLIANDSSNMKEIVNELSKQPIERRGTLRRDMVERLEFMDAKYFVDKIEEVL